MIVIGADGSQGALEAVSWAIREADMRGTRVRIVHVVPAWADEIPVDTPHAYLGRRICESATSVLTEAMRWAGRQTPGVEVESQLLRGDPRLALIRASKDAELLVVGSHGLVLLAEAVAGRSERYPDVKLVEHIEWGHPVEVLKRASMVRHASCPVAVVPS